MTQGAMKLTALQKKVIKDVQDGSVIVTSDEAKGAWICSKTKEYHIDNGVFFRLVNKGLIFQQLSPPFYYVLTKEGREYQTKQRNS